MTKKSSPYCAVLLLCSFSYLAFGQTLPLVSPAKLGFPSTPVGGTSPPQVITVSNTNTGAVALTGISITLAGASPTDFSQTNTCGTSGGTLAVGAKCQISVTFAPASAASFAATVSIANSAANTPQLVPLTGTAGGASVATPSCSNCYAAFGAGAVQSLTKFGDYNDSSNTLVATHLGASTPQFSVGVAYKLPIYGPFAKIKQLNCNTAAYTDTVPEAHSIYCFPLKAFINLKFTPDASQTFNGFTFGISHSLASHLDLMLGISYSAYNEVSPGFIVAAVAMVKAQQTASNSYYAQYNAVALQADGPTAFDGFPVALQNANGTTGALIYSGSPLTVHYHSGLFLGVQVPLSLGSLFGIKP